LLQLAFESIGYCRVDDHADETRRCVCHFIHEVSYSCMPVVPAMPNTHISIPRKNDQLENPPKDYICKAAPSTSQVMNQYHTQSMTTFCDDALGLNNLKIEHEQ